MNNEVTVRFLQDTATKNWLWKLYDETGSVVAKSEIIYSTEADAQAAFEAWQKEPAPAPENVEPTEVKTEDAPIAPAQTVTPEEADGVITKDELHDLNSQTPERETDYELVNKATGEVLPVLKLTFGDNESTDCVIADTTNGPVRFENAAKEGNLVDTDNSNPDYAIRQVGTHLTPNNDGVINNQGVELNPTEDGVGSAQ